MNKTILELYCGTLHFKPWINHAVGLCWYELCIFVPCSLVLFLMTLCYSCLLWKHAAFETLHCWLFYARLVLDMLILVNEFIIIALYMLFPVHDETFLHNSNFFVIHSGILLFLWISVTIHDYLLGKSTRYSSRGPLVHLLIFIIYFVNCVVLTWSSVKIVDKTWRNLTFYSFLAHLVLIALHLLTKVPVVFASEDSRTKTARLLRQKLNNAYKVPVNLTGFKSCSVANEDSGIFLSKLTFHWITPTIINGFFGELFSVRFLPTLPKHLNVNTLESLLDTRPNFVKKLCPNPDKRRFRHTILLIKYGYKFFGCEFIILGLVKLFLTCLNLSIPFALNRFIHFLSDNNRHYEQCILYGTAVVAISLIITIINSFFNYRMATFNYKIRISLIGMIYRLILSINTSSLSTVGTGTLINNLTTDVDCILNLAPSLHELWAMPLQIIVSICLLYNQLGVSFMVGIAVLVILLPLNQILAKQIGKYSTKLLLFKDTRINFLTELLPNMVAVKLSCWELLMRKRIMKARKSELNALKGVKLLDAGCVFCWASLYNVLASSTFATYVALGNKLEATVVFTSLSLFGLLIGPVNSFFWVVSGIVQSGVSIHRVSKLFRLAPGFFDPSVTSLPLNCLKRTKSCCTINSSLSSLKTPMQLASPHDPRWGQTPFVINWTNKSFYFTDPTTVALNQIDLKVKWGQMVVVSGSVGSGKSALLQAILGELNELNTDELDTEDSGLVQGGHRLKYAYVGQTPWLHGGTIKENILFGAKFNSNWFQCVVEACELQADLERFPLGVDTNVGEGGVGCLSGGQRTRVALARAVYQKADVYLFDDPFSTLDVSVARAVSRKCMTDLLAGQTRIIVSSQPDVLLSADRKYSNPTVASIICDHLLVELDHGKIAKQSSIRSGHGETLSNLLPNSLLISAAHPTQVNPCTDNDSTMLNPVGDNDHSLVDCNTHEQDNKNDDDDDDDDDIKLLNVEADLYETSLNTFPNENRSNCSRDVENVDDGDDDHDSEIVPLMSTTGMGLTDGADCELATWERLAYGSIKFDVYAFYAKSAGWCFVAIIVISLCLMQGSRNASDLWLSKWVDSLRNDTTKWQSHANASHNSDQLITRQSYTVLSTHMDNSVNTFESSPHQVQSEVIMNADLGQPTVYASNFYLWVYISIVVVNLVTVLFRSISFAVGGLVAASVVHEHALDSVLEGTVAYFDTTPPGCIINRFSSDVNTVDSSLPFVLNILFANIVSLLGVIVVVCVSLPSLIVLFIPMAFVFWSVQRLYRGAARDLKRLSSISRTPVYEHYTDTINGLSIIRGLGQQMRFRHLIATKLSNELRTEVASLASSSWLGLRLQFIGNVILLGTILMAICDYVFNWIQVAAVGLAVTYSMNISNLMTSTICQLTETEKNLVSTERCQELVDDTPVELDVVPVNSATPQLPSRSRTRLRLINASLKFKNLPSYQSFADDTVWPSQGVVEFKNVSLTYPTHQQFANPSALQNNNNNNGTASNDKCLALDEIHFAVQSGERVGIVGRTGSGKSSLIKVLMRLVDHFPGPYSNQYVADQRRFFGATGQVFVDGVDIRTVPLSILRSRIMTICQDPFLFSGSLRDNLDPDGILNDSVLADVLIKCQLASNIEEAVGWLDRQVGESGKHISAGQRQLICLARALLRQPKPKVICFDEATASVDNDSERLIYDVIDGEFRGVTMLIIAHRLLSVRKLCSRVIVMKSGKILAQGEPEQTLQLAFNEDVFSE